MIRLNLGCGSPHDPSWHPIEDSRFVNRDPGLDGWRFEDGLGDYETGSVEGITISHALMYLPLALWPAFFAEVSRVLADGGVTRITEDNVEHPESRTYPKGWQGSQRAVTMTGPKMVREHLEAAGLDVYDCAADETHFSDTTLIQAQHGEAPHCFWIEAVRRTGVLFEPHADDSALFASFTMLRYRPRVVTCFGSAGDYGSTETRHLESVEAAKVLGAGPVEQWDGDITQRMIDYDAKFQPSRVWAPSTNTSHPDHLAVALSARQVFGDRVRQYQTYNAAGKVRGDPVPFEAGWLELKRRALACYLTQRAHPRARVFFDPTKFDLAEYE